MSKASVNNSFISISGQHINIQITADRCTPDEIISFHKEIIRLNNEMLAELWEKADDRTLAYVAKKYRDSIYQDGSPASFAHEEMARRKPNLYYSIIGEGTSRLDREDALTAFIIAFPFAKEEEKIIPRNIVTLGNKIAEKRLGKR